MRTKLIVILSFSTFAGACAHSPKAPAPASPPAATAKPVTAPTPVTAPPTVVVEDKTKYACLRAGESRSIRIESVQPKGCKVWYSVIGKESPVAWSTTGTSHCETVSGKMRTNLESAGYKCALNETRSAASTTAAVTPTAPAAPEAPAPVAPAKTK